jgi:hypothetical protein
MTRYRVCVTRDTTESTYVEVEASNPEEADTKAFEHVYETLWIGPTAMTWEPDDYVGSPYLPAPGEADELP